MTVLMSISLMKAIFHTYNLEKKQGAIDKRLSIAISRRNRRFQTFVNSEYALKSLLTNVCQYICNNDYGVNIGQVTSSRSAAYVQISVFYREFSESLETSKMRVKFQY